LTTLLTGGGTRSREALDDDVDLARDRALVTRAQAGDRTAFDDLYVRYYRRLYRFCLRRLHDSYEAEDVAQEAFSRAWRALPTFAGDRRFYPWLSVIAAHLCTDVLRRRNRSTPVAEFHQGNVASTEDGGEELMLAAVDSDLVARAFKRLSDRHQRILQLREGSGWSYQKIADHEGVGITAVETLLWRARQALKREFAALAGAEGRIAAWVGSAVSLAALRRFLRLPAHAARRLVHLGESGTAVAMGSAAAATAMVVAATLSGPTAQAPGQLPGAPGLLGPGNISTISGPASNSVAGGSIPGASSAGANASPSSSGSSNGNSPGNATGGIDHTLSGAPGTIGGTAAVLGNAGGTIVGGVNEAVNGAANGVTGAVQSLTGGLTNGVTNALSSIGQLPLGTVNGVLNQVLGTNTTGLTNTLNGAVSKVGSTVSTAVQGVKTTVGGLLGSTSGSSSAGHSAGGSKSGSSSLGTCSTSGLLGGVLGGLGGLVGGVTGSTTCGG